MTQMVERSLIGDLRPAPTRAPIGIVTWFTNMEVATTRLRTAGGV